MPAQVSNGLVFGVAAFVAMAGTDLLSRAIGTPPIAIIGRLALPLLAAIAGRRTVDAGTTVGNAALAGLVVGGISGLAVILHVLLFGLTPSLPPFSDILSYVIVLGLGAGAAAIGGATGRRKAD
jgi:hypothetical protein